MNMKIAGCRRCAAVCLAGVAVVAMACGTGLAQAGEAPVKPRLQLLDWELATRFAYADEAAGDVTGRQLEVRSRSVAQFRLDGHGRDLIQMRVETGNGFDNSWDETPVGLAPANATFHVKTFALIHRFSEQVRAEGGGMEFERGSGTEATLAAGEGWMTGYRATGEHLAHLPTRVVVTAGYVGDFLQPEFFLRTRRLGEINYVQGLMEQRLSAHTTGSLEMDGIAGHGFVRGGYHVEDGGGERHAEWVVEAVERLSGDRTFGWSASGAAAVVPSGKLRLAARYSDLPDELYRGSDGGQMLPNGGEIGRGRRAAVIPTYTLLPGMVMEVLVARRLDDVQTTNRWRAFVAIHYDAGSMVRTAARLRHASVPTAVQ